MVKGYPHPVVEVLAEERDLGVALAEVVQHDELSLHLHAYVDGLRGGARGQGGIRTLVSPTAPSPYSTCPPNVAGKEVR